MDTRIQFRVDEETKRLAQQMAESQGRTLSEACRELTEQLAEQQRKIESHQEWLANEVNQAFAKLEEGNAHFIEQTDAQTEMERRKANIRSRFNKA
ncbi:type II toxin-antitoxin system RelB/DinJ family antitoxin [Litoribrevibacter albus]|uniref:RelB protein n=1 Tax=Litoribrevibacter albus TaxID=1473156 RepID=A0AA37SDM7_9GAMM|nr:type II toxin-antitoxin system RelB/DinJ family antitoxin [Litoribrevibacter albus]GLQ32586.1 RelB protein [Litoribrevibacter albus]